MANNLSLIHSTTWPEVLGSWRVREEEIWRPYYTERGFHSWAEWRQKLIDSLQPVNRKWDFYRIDGPFSTIPTFLVGAYKGWRKYYPKGQRVVTFAEIVRHRDLPQNSKVKSMLKDFPSPTTIIALKCGDRIAVFEGTHRCAAIALSASRGELFTADVTVALTEFGVDEAGLFQKMIEQTDV